MHSFLNFGSLILSALFLLTVECCKSREIVKTSSPSTIIIATPVELNKCESKSIPPDYFLYKDSYYKFHKDPQTWTEARKICEAEGGHLIIINSEDEANFLVRLMTQHPDAVLDDTVSNKNYIFIGFHDLFQEGEYVTVDGESIRKSGYVHWRQGEPDGHSSENCGTFHRNGGLNDSGCDLRLPYVCEIAVKKC